MTKQEYRTSESDVISTIFELKLVNVSDIILDVEPFDDVGANYFSTTFIADTVC